MPISDQDEYEKGHFSRVYNHIIKPACEKAGFEAIRADDEVKTNYIALDIVKKIIESDLVLCDLSSKNPNVLYELGIRQAFNKKVVLIKDKKTGRIFDIQGFRTIDYDENLRIDEVQKSISSISSTLKETFESEDGEINSFLQLLSLKPASLNEQIEISPESSIIMDLLNSISDRINNLEKSKSREKNLISNKVESRIIHLGGYSFKIGNIIYTKDGKNLGEIIGYGNEGVILKSNNKITFHDINSEIFNNITPF